jgi:hypothetical protein
VVFCSIRSLGYSFNSFSAPRATRHAPRGL